MSFLLTSDLRQRLAATIRSGGRGGLTSAQDVRDFLGLLLDELEAAEAATLAPTAADVVHLAGAETITGVKTFTGDVLVGNGQDGSGLKIRKADGSGYQRLLDVTNVGRAASINFGAVGEGGDLRYHGATHRWIAPPGGPEYMHLDEQANLAVAGRVQATAFVGDGAQLTGLPSQTVLEFAFEPGSANELTTTLTGGQAGRFTLETDRNVASYTLARNGQPVDQLPLDLVTGDVLTVAIARQDASQPARLLLQAGPGSRHFTFYGAAPAYVPTALLRSGGSGGLRVPALPGAVAVAFWLRALDNGQYGSFLVDFRAHGTGYWWSRTDRPGFTAVAIDGQPASSYQPVFAPGWHKVYLEFPTLAQGFSLLSRLSDTEFFYPCDIADITFYNRSFTAAEQADATGPLPLAGMLACYRRLAADRRSVVDSLGQAPDLALVGTPLTDEQPQVWVRGQNLVPGVPLREWPNAGHSGDAQRLVADPAADGGVPLALRDAQNGQSFARFEGHDWLTTSGPLGLATPGAFAVVLVFRVHRLAPAGMNLLGWGAQQQGQMFDIYQGGAGDQLSADYYGPGNTLCNVGGVKPGHWQVLHLTNEGTQQPYLDGVAPGPAAAATTPQDSPLRVGAGFWPNLNNLETIDIAECRVYDTGNMLAYDRPALLAELARTYSGGAAQQDYPVDAAAWTFSADWAAYAAADRSDIKMPFPQLRAQYAAVQPDTQAEFSFRVAGGAPEGVRVYGMVEGRGQVAVYLDGVLRQTLSGTGRYVNTTGTLCEFFGLPAGPHTLRLVKTQGDGGPEQGLMVSGATVFSAD